MIFYTIYNTKNGEILFTGNAVTEEEVEKMTLGGQAYILEKSKEFQYVKNGILLDMPTKPAGNYLFDYSLEEWVFDEQSAEAQVINKRDQLLKEGPDRINPMWWSSMTTEEQQAWTKYRQDLLNVPQQSGFPTDIIWPITPGA